MDTVVRLAVAIPLGLVFGSFLTVAIHRVPSGESLVAPRSRCPSCGNQIRSIDNVPVLSWLLLRGRCRACRARISLIYPATELASAALFAAVALRFENPWTDVLVAPFLGLLAALTVIDARHQILPNRLIYPALLLAGGYVVVADLATGSLHAVDAGIGLLAYGGGLLVVALLAPRGMGMGDVKLAGLIGLVLGGVDLAFVAVAAAAGILAGGLVSIGALVAGVGRKARLPFGPWMALGAAVAAFAGRDLVDAYVRLIGG